MTPIKITIIIMVLLFYIVMIAIDAKRLQRNLTAYQQYSESLEKQRDNLTNKAFEQSEQLDHLFQILEARPCK